MLMERVLPDITRYPVFPSLLPDGRIWQHRYRAAFATTLDELDAIQQLRLEVFNLELGEGLRSSLRTRRDVDGFDSVCHHLMVPDDTEAFVVGTYRMQTAAMARRHLGH